MVEEESRAASASPSSNPAAADVLNAASREKADAYLDEQIVVARAQTEVLRLQAHELKDELRLHHWSSRVRHASDILKVTFEIGIALIAAALVVFLGGAIWNASQAQGLVVDSFAVPPAFVQAGIAGNVVADDMTQKIGAIHDFANGYSLAHSNDVREAREQEVKVEIPDTGISISEAWRYLKLWLGNERHVSGNLRAIPDGRVALTVSLGGADTFTFAGKPADLDALEQKAAERVFETVEPVNYVLYLSGKNRSAETLEWAARNLSLWSDNQNLSEAYALYGDMLHYITGDVRRALALSTIALALDPKGTPPHMEALNASRDLGHDEDVLAQARLIPNLKVADNVASWRTGPGYPYVQELAAINRPSETGDYTSLSALPCPVYCSRASALVLHAEAYAHLHDGARALELIAQAQTFGAPGGWDVAWTRYAAPARAQYFVHATAEDWRAAANDARRIANDFLDDKGDSATLDALRVRNLAAPLLAHALAASGDVAAARKAIGATAPDCYACVRERGNVEALADNWSAAARWFADAVRLGPSIPFAYADWGAMLLHEGKYDAAIEKFREANLKGPHFADPLEMWGEALMQKNRSDLAIAKFEEANKYAPNWGRLHLEWGKALVYAGRKDDAQKQFAVAASLDLSNADRAALSKLRRA